MQPIPRVQARFGYPSIGTVSVCDVRTAQCRPRNFGGSEKVTAFSFRRKRENGIAGKGKGMENQYEENLLRPYSKIFLDGGTSTEIGCSFDSTEKADCAGHVFSDGTIECFDDLHTLVSEILRKWSALDRERPFRVQQRHRLEGSDCFVYAQRLILPCKKRSVGFAGSSSNMLAPPGIFVIWDGTGWWASGSSMCPIPSHRRW